MNVNQGQLSEIVGVSAVTLTEWQKESPPLPMRARKTNGLANEYDTVEVIRWMVQREMNRAKIETPQDRLARVKADREELGLKRDQGILIDAAELAPLMDRYVSDVSNTLAGLPESYSPLLEQVGTPEGRFQLLRQMVIDVQKVIGDYEFCKPAAGAHLQEIAAAA